MHSRVVGTLSQEIARHHSIPVRDCILPGPPNIDARPRPLNADPLPLPPPVAVLPHSLGLSSPSSLPHPASPILVYLAHAPYSARASTTLRWSCDVTSTDRLKRSPGRVATSTPSTRSASLAPSPTPRNYKPFFGSPLALSQSRSARFRPPHLTLRMQRRLLPLRLPPTHSTLQSRPHK